MGWTSSLHSHHSQLQARACICDANVTGSLSKPPAEDPRVKSHVKPFRSTEPTPPLKSEGKSLTASGVVPPALHPACPLPLFADTREPVQPPADL